MVRRSISVGSVVMIAAALGACSGRLGLPGEGGQADGLTGGPGTGVEGGGVPQEIELGSGLKLEGSPVFYRVVRLKHSEWDASVRDVLLLTAAPGLAPNFLPDAVDSKFDNNERVLFVADDGVLWLDYQNAAESVAESVAGDGVALGRLGSADNVSGFIASVGRRAFRRALSDEELAAYQTLWDSGAHFYASGDGFADGARVFIEALLQSPHFLYRVQLSEAGQRLVGTELATRLSYFLRGTTPSDALLDSAIAGQLDTPEGLLAVASEMLAADQARVSVEHFHSQLFGLHRYKSILKSTTKFPTYTEGLNPVLHDAEVMFLSRIFTENFGLRELLTSNVAFVSDATAFIYGVPSPGPTLTAVTLDGTRPGFLTRAGFLAYNGTLNDPDPIHRGVDINRRLLCSDISPPPGEIPPLPAYEAGQTNRERVVAHTEAAGPDGRPSACAGCHSTIINPPGFALENFDALGVARTEDNGKPVDTTGTFGLLDGEQSFSNIIELTQLLANSRKVHSCYAAHVSEFVFGRDLTGSDVPLLDEMEITSREQDLSLRQLLLNVVASDRFSLAMSGTP